MGSLVIATKAKAEYSYAIKVTNLSNIYLQNKKAVSKDTL
jgi:hypothetical protein